MSPRLDYRATDAALAIAEAHADQAEMATARVGLDQIAAELGIARRHLLKARAMLYRAEQAAMRQQTATVAV